MRHIIIVIVLFLVNHAYTQKEGYIWYFGNKAGIDFNQTPPVPLTDGDMNQDEGCASISDSDGNLLFYSDGISVWNRNHNTMPNGTGLMGSASGTMSGVIVPMPGSSEEYYLFSVPENNDGVYYSIVDMSLQSGLGDVDPARKSILLFPAGIHASQKITAVKHANDSDFWIISHEKGSANFRIYLITNTGISDMGTDNIGSIHSTSIKGYLRASPDGSKLACALQEDDNLEIFDFNTSTGDISNCLSLSNIYSGMPMNGEVYGLEFSSDATKLYVSERFITGRIYQYDLSTPSPYTRTLIGTVEPTGAIFQGAGALQLAPDGKIYVCINGEDTISTIDNPNNAGMACNYNHKSFSLNGQICGEGFPNFITNYMEPTPVEFIEFAGFFNQGIVELRWSTASESNNDYFLIERMNQNQVFENIGMVNGNGTINHWQNYIFKDFSPFSGIIYYRLKQVDFDGKFEYSKTISVNTHSSNLKYTIYPNPAVEFIQIEYRGNATAGIHFSIFNSSGELVRKHEYVTMETGSKIQFSTGDLPSGNYFVRITNSDNDEALLDCIRFCVDSE